MIKNNGHSQQVVSTYISIVFFSMGSIASPTRNRYSSLYVRPPPNSCTRYSTRS